MIRRIRHTKHITRTYFGHSYLLSLLLLSSSIKPIEKLLLLLTVQLIPSVYTQILRGESRRKDETHRAMN